MKVLLSYIGRILYCYCHFQYQQFIIIGGASGAFECNLCLIKFSNKDELDFTAELGIEIG
jgi:hypothetical protein